MNSNFLITKIQNVIFVNNSKKLNTRSVFNHNLDYNELIFHFSGEVTVYFNDYTLKTTANTIRYLPKGDNKKYIVETEFPGECIVVYFDTDIPVSDKAFVINLKNNAKISNLFKKIFSVWVSKNSGYYFESISLINKIFAEMQKSNYIPNNQYNKLKPALDYIENNFLTEKISIPFLASKCGTSESYLKRLFTKNFGMSPIKYIIQLKINYACDLLHSGLYNITQISEQCGYQDVYYFSHQFKEYMGVSPSAFLNEYKSSK